MIQSNEKQEQLAQMLPSESELSAAQLAACYGFAPEHLMAMCRSSVMPISVYLVNGCVTVRYVDVHRYFGVDDQELETLPETAFKPAAHRRHSPKLLKHEILERWFLSELRAGIFSDQAMGLIGSLTLKRNQQLDEPGWEHCKQMFSFEMAVHNAEVASVQAHLGALHKELAAKPPLIAVSEESLR